VAAVYKNSMFVFGGYDGSSRLNDFLEFKFWPGEGDEMIMEEGEDVVGWLLKGGRKKRDGRFGASRT